MATVEQTYNTTQSDTVVISPSSGKKLYIWQVKVASDVDVDLRLDSAENPIVEVGTTGGTIGKTSINLMGTANQDLVVTTGDGDTVVSVLYDEMD